MWSVYIARDGDVRNLLYSKCDCTVVFLSGFPSRPLSVKVCCDTGGRVPAIVLMRASIVAAADLDLPL